MPDTKASLLHLISKLTAHTAEGESVRQRFNRLPDRVMDEHNLPADARLALLSMDMGSIGDFLKAELLAWKFPTREFPEIDPDCALPGSGALPGQYPVPNPEVKAIDKPTAAAGATETLTVFGEGFVFGAGLRLVAGATTQDYFDKVNGAVVVTGTFRCARLIATVKLPNTAGAYDVQVLNKVGPNAGDLHVLTKKKVTLTLQ